jgi:hypothetical protein
MGGLLRRIQCEDGSEGREGRRIRHRLSGSDSGKTGALPTVCVLRMMCPALARPLVSPDRLVHPPRNLTVVADRDRDGAVVWAEGRDAARLRRFYSVLGTERTAALEAVSLDMGRA